MYGEICERLKVVVRNSEAAAIDLNGIAQEIFLLSQISENASNTDAYEAASRLSELSAKIIKMAYALSNTITQAHIGAINENITISSI